MSNSNNDLISVIVPVYNVEAYVDRCVQSIVNQTYRNLEIILVDDGSTDSSSAKCDEWAKLDTRIIVIHQENGGQARARNEGLRIATGSKIGFVDSDDYIDATMYDSMNQIMIENDCDVVECSMQRFYQDNKIRFGSGAGQTNLMNREEAIMDFIQEKHLQCTVPNMLVRSNIAKAVLFDEGKTHEDILWPYRVYVRSNKIAYVDLAYYFYFQRPNSTMNVAYSEKRFDGLDALEMRSVLVKNDFPNQYSLAVRAYLGSCMYQYQFLCRQPKSEEYEKYKKVLYNRFCNGDQKALLDGLRIKHKIWYQSFKTLPTFTCKIRNLLRIGL